MRRIRSVEGARGIAAMSILVFHVFIGSAPDGRLGYEVMKWGWVGVPLFFLISGLLLFRPFAAAIIHQRPFPSIRRYARSRFLRIFPAFWAALTASILATGHALSSGALAANYSLSFFAFKMVGVLAVAWTLCIEVSFYALLPLIALAFLKLSNRAPSTPAERGRLIVVVLLPTFPLSYWYLERAGQLPTQLPPALPGYMAEFTIGMLLAVALELRPQVSATASRAMLVGAVVLLVIADSIYRVGVTGLNLGPFQAGLLFVLTAETGFGLALASILMRNEQTLLGRTLGCRPLVWLGTISYGIYLWHPFAIERILTTSLWRSAPTNLIFVIPGTIALATASWFLIEKPSLALKQRPLIPRQKLRETLPTAVEGEPAA